MDRLAASYAYSRDTRGIGSLIKGLVSYELVVSMDGRVP